MKTLFSGTLSACSSGANSIKRLVEGEDRRQATLLPDCLEEDVTEDNPVRVIDAFVDELDLAALGFAGVTAKATGRPSYHPAILLKIYLYGDLNRVPSSRRLERETQRNLEPMWLAGWAVGVSGPTCKRRSCSMDHVDRRPSNTGRELPQCGSAENT